MNSQSRNKNNTSDDLIKEYLENGGVITVGEPGARTENIVTTGGMWGRRKKAAPVTDETKDNKK